MDKSLIEIDIGPYLGMFLWAVYGLVLFYIFIGRPWLRMTENFLDKHK